VNITFQEGGGLGSSSTAFVNTTYANYKAALTADASGADDVAALAQLNALAYGGTSIDLSTANARALGFNAPASPDGTITLNTSLCFFNHNSPVAGQYDLYAVACHEMDEVLGTSSGVGGSFQDTDLFRYNGAGARSFNTNTAQHAYFSIDGATNVVEYNQFGRTGGDWGDWIVHTPPQVQDWQGTTGKTIDPGASEFRLLDVIGYNRAPVPEPATMIVLGAGALAAIRRRRKS
jgi:hypothetical protein